MLVSVSVITELSGLAGVISDSVGVGADSVGVGADSVMAGADSVGAGAEVVGTAGGDVTSSATMGETSGAWEAMVHLALSGQSQIPNPPFQWSPSGQNCSVQTPYRQIS